MSTTLTPPRPQPVMPPRPRQSPTTIAAGTVLFLLLVAGIWSINSLGINPSTLIDSVGNAVDFIGRMFPLDFPPAG